MNTAVSMGAIFPKAQFGRFVIRFKRGNMRLRWVGFVVLGQLAEEAEV